MPHWNYCMTCVIVYSCIHMSTLLSSACNFGVFSLASEEENRILHNGRFWFEGGHYFDLFSNTYTICDREWNFVWVEGGEWRPRIEREAERCS